MPNELMKTLTIGANTYDLPQKTSDLTNDSGYLTSAVTSFNGSTGAVTYTAPVTSVNGSTGAVTLSIPTKASDIGAVPRRATAGGGASGGTITNSASSITLSEYTEYTGSGLLSMSTSYISLEASSDASNVTASITLSTKPPSSSKVNNIVLSNGQTTIIGVVTPTADGMAANKKYVDDSITAAIGTAIGGSY